MKNKPDVVALEDSDYPHWLWGLLDGSEKQSNSGSGGVDVSSKYTLILVNECVVLIVFVFRNAQERTETS